MNCRCVCSAARSRATSPLNARVSCPSSSSLIGGPRSSSPVSGIAAARCAIAVIGRSPTDASQGRRRRRAAARWECRRSIASAARADRAPDRSAGWRRREHVGACRTSGDRRGRAMRRAESRRSGSPDRGAADAPPGPSARANQPRRAGAVAVEDRQRPARGDRRWPRLPRRPLRRVELAQFLVQHVGQLRAVASSSPSTRRMPIRRCRPQYAGGEDPRTARAPACTRGEAGAKREAAHDCRRPQLIALAAPGPDQRLGARVDRACAAAAARRRRRRSRAGRSARPRRARRCRRG